MTGCEQSLKKDTALDRFQDYSCSVLLRWENSSESMIKYEIMSNKFKPGVGIFLSEGISKIFGTSEFSEV